MMMSMMMSLMMAMSITMMLQVQYSERESERGGSGVGLGSRERLAPPSSSSESLGESMMMTSQTISVWLTNTEVLQ